MEQALFILLWVVVGLLVLVMGAALLLWRYHLKSVGMLKSQVESVQDKLDDANEVIKKMKETAHTEDEYVALEGQVSDLMALRDNLNKQVQLVEIQKATLEAQVTGTRTQITSANTQFKQLTAQITELDAIVKRKCHTVDEEVAQYREGEVAKVAAETEAQRREALEGLTKAVSELRRELEELQETKTKAAEDYAELTEGYKGLEQAHRALSVAHAEALRRDVLESAGGGRIRLSDADRQDAELLLRTCRGMRCENAVRKATYDVYVKPEMERIIRELGVAGVSGIYRIWRTVDGRDLSYIGQAVDVGERWKTHAKRAWGVDNTGRIVLYQKMMEDGIELWNWELVEECQPSANEVSADLSQREKYWGEFYAVKELGLNKKLG